MIDPAGTESNFSPANIGQAKWMAWAAVNELERYLPAIAEQVRSDLSGIVDFSRPQTPEDFQTQLSPLNNG